MSIIDKVCLVAQTEVGYLEKSDGKYLDDKTKGASSGNWCKYWRDVYPQYQGSAWCACFVTWCLNQVVGKDGTANLLGHYPFVYCPTLGAIGKTKGQLYSIKDCQKGDIVLFYSGGTFAHTGIVIENTGSKITTVEGNTSGGSTVVANGGGVACKTYNYTYINFTKKGTVFYRPKYNLYEEDDDMTDDRVKELAKEATADIINEIGADIEALNGKDVKQDELIAKRNEQIWDVKCAIDDLTKSVDNLAKRIEALENAKG